MEDSLFKGEPEVLQGGEKSDVAPSLSRSRRPPSYTSQPRGWQSGLRLERNGIS